MGTETANVDAHEPLLVDANDAAAMLGVSRSKLYKMKSSGQLPLPVRFAGGVRWRVDELRAWVDSGCPSCERWAATRERSVT